MVGVPGVEPGTSSLSGTRSNQLSYTPVAWWRRPGSNRRHPACKAGALPTELRPRWGTRRECRRARMFMICLSRACSVQKGCDPETLIPLSENSDFTVARALPRGLLLRKEVIQPLVPQRLPCYDFIPITTHTLDGSVPCGFGFQLRVQTAFMM